MVRDHPYRLRSLVVDDFKSIRRAEVELLPLSIVVGANSSGKSSLMQVILAISQAVRSRSAGATFPLNGEYARFGTFTETARFRTRGEDASSDRHIMVQVTLSDTDERGFFRDEEEESEDSAVKRFYLDWHLALAPHESPASGTAKIDHVWLRCYEQSEDNEPLTVMQYGIDGIADMASKEAEPAYRVLVPMHPRGHTDQELTRTGEAYVEHVEDEESTRLTCDAVHLLGAIPRQTYALSTIAEAVGRRWWDIAQIMVTSLSSTDEESPDLNGQKATAAVVDVEADDLQLMIDSATKAAQRFRDTLDDRSARSWIPSMMLQMHYFLGEQFRKDPDLQDGITRGLQSLSLEAFLDELDNRLSEHSWAQEQVWTPQEDLGEPSVEWSHVVISSFFGRSVKYLGPLRKAPQVLYDPRLRDLELGLSGEYTAAILHANSHYQIVPIGSDTSERVALEIEVNKWLNRFGLATKAELKDRGRLGIGLQIRPIAGIESVDLTSVGVGVSQILPVIVLCLLAQPGDLVILEQPELHLHPALQQQLGDFLLDCAKSGRQLLIETHSEHLVNRVRRRVADPSGADEGMVSLLFAEQVDGVTELRQSVIDPYGGSESEWPSGFFDISAAEAQALVSTSLTKRYRETD
ncbi:MAG: DUF3696 domain-containing protein [Acidimicrobiaceae bacterium]|nr:DUF3696 domain-containing protein [Acidimicrobiaceae bacterium]